MTVPMDLIVPIEDLRWICAPESLNVTDTDEVAGLEEQVLAQDRATQALEFGLGMGGLDYNIYVAGEPRTGLTYLTRTFLEAAAKNKSSPPDWCYVHNFRYPDRPKALSLPRGLAREFAKDMEELLEDIQAQIPEVFMSEEYRQRREEVVRQFNQERNQALATLESSVTQSGFLLNMTQEGMMIVPAKDGRIMTEEDLKLLTEDDKTNLRLTSERLQGEMNQTVLTIRRMEKQVREKHREIDRRMALHAVGYLIEELQEKYQDLRQVLTYLHDVKNDVVKNLADFRPKEQPPSPFPMPRSEPDFSRFKINVIIDNSEVQGAPVIFEMNPTYSNLFGAMERRASFGTLFTDFTMIRPGSMHRANGGFLVIPARELLKWYISWEALKRALKNKEIKIEDPAEMFGFITTKGMTPDPVPLKLKIILVGETYLYHLLLTHDDQFPKLFKVKVHLDHEVDRGREEIDQYVRFAARVAKQRQLRPVDRAALARLVEYGVELAGRRKKMTLKMALIRDILREADFWAGREGALRIMAPHVDRAIAQKKSRSGLPEAKLREFIQDGYLTVETTGCKVGQVNGLSVHDLGDHSFGRPSRLTASVSLGRQGVVAIDRESKLSGNIHTKGVLIMEGYLRDRYAAERPLSLSASLVFEQTYGPVDGDSASAAELAALLSRIAGVGLKQGLALTGAISQHGEILPVGGVNQKIEGFFKLCQYRGLTGEHGVVIPRANVPDLMLDSDIIQAVRDGLFNVYAVNHADQVLELLGGRPAGQRDGDGQYPEGSFNRLVEDKLRDLHEKALKLMKDEKESRPGPEDSTGRGSCGVDWDPPPPTD